MNQFNYVLTLSDHQQGFEFGQSERTSQLTIKNDLLLMSSQVIEMQQENKELSEKLFDLAKKNNILEKQNEELKNQFYQQLDVIKKLEIEDKLKTELIKGLKSAFNFVEQKNLKLANKNIYLEKRIREVKAEQYKSKFSNLQVEAVAENTLQIQKEIDDSNKELIKLIEEVTQAMSYNIEKGVKERENFTNKKLKIGQDALKITENQQLVMCHVCGNYYKRNGINLHMSKTHGQRLFTK